jgi:hypothetical protein
MPRLDFVKLSICMSRPMSRLTVGAKRRQTQAQQRP